MAERSPTTQAYDLLHDFLSRSREQFLVSQQVTMSHFNLLDEFIEGFLIDENRVDCGEVAVVNQVRQMIMGAED